MSEPSWRRHILACAAVSALSTGLLAATPTSAQTASSAEANAEIDEVVVTARRREESLLEVPVAVSAASGAALEKAGVSNPQDLTRVVPGLISGAGSTRGFNQLVLTIRGMRNGEPAITADQSIGVYFAEVPQNAPQGLNQAFFDLRSVQVLKGPQGTLFGRNATGGAVQFISAQPTEEFEGYGAITYGRFNQVIAEGALSGALSDTLTARVSGQYTRDDGYIKNITPGQPDRGADNHWALRGILLWKPSSDFKAKLTVRYAKASRERQAGIYSLEPTCPNAQFQGEFLGPNEFCSYWGVTGTTGNGYANPAITPSQGGNPWRTAGTGDAYVDRDVFGASLRLDAKIGAFDVTSITDYQHLKKFYIEQGDSVPEFPYVPQGPFRDPGPCPAPAQSVTCYTSGTVFFQRAKTNQVSQEIRAAATFGKNYLTVGAFGMIIDGKFNAKYAVPFIGYDPDVAFSQRTESFAFFAQNEFKIDDQWKLIGGIRYWQDKKRGVYNAIAPTGPYALSLYFGPDDIRYNDTTGTVTPGSWSFSSGAPSGVTTRPSAANPTFRGVTARAEIDYKPTPETLIYASYNRGSKSGGFTFSTGTPFPTQLVDVLNNIPYRPETLNAYEVGLKAKLPGNTQFNLAAFYYDYKNYQAFVQVFAAQVVRNLPAKIKGIEADITSRPIPGLTLQLSGALQDSEVKDVLLPDATTVKTSNLPQAPGFAGNALVRYEFDTGIGRASLQADALYTGKFCFTVLCAPVERERAYAVANLRVGLSPKGTNLDLAFFVNNLFERRYRVYAFDASTYWGYTTGVYAKPRTWGVNAVWHFGK